MNVLVIAPHKDDEVLGVGGTIAKYTSNGNIVYVCIVCSGKEPLFSSEKDKKAQIECIQADKYLGVKETIFLDYPAAMLETIPRHMLNNSFIMVIQKIKPEVVYLPHRGDMQLDHKMVVDAAMVALRPKYNHVVKKIYAYETLSETGWDVPNISNDFVPTSYNDISDYLDKKVDALRMFKSQVAEFPNARSSEAVKALAMYRGATMKLRAAESFILIREIQE